VALSAQQKKTLIALGTGLVGGLGIAAFFIGSDPDFSVGQLGDPIFWLAMIGTVGVLFLLVGIASMIKRFFRWLGAKISQAGSVFGWSVWSIRLVWAIATYAIVPGFILTCVFWRFASDDDVSTALKRPLFWLSYLIISAILMIIIRSAQSWLADKRTVAKPPTP
jgi:hypothetical protein